MTEKSHWQNVYETRDTQSLGWFEQNPAPCLRLIARCALDKHEPILDVGAGATTLIDNLLDQGFDNVIALDISGAALEKLQQRLGPERAARVEWIVDDMAHPGVIRDHAQVCLWHDRALLHFFTERHQQQAYLATLKTLVKKGGFVSIGVFSMDGAPRCSGLELKRYDADLLAAFLGPGFKLLESFSHTHTMPSGDPRPYIYALFQREK